MKTGTKVVLGAGIVGLLTYLMWPKNNQEQVKELSYDDALKLINTKTGIPTESLKALSVSMIVAWGKAIQGNTSTFRYSDEVYSTASGLYQTDQDRII